MNFFEGMHPLAIVVVIVCVLFAGVLRIIPGRVGKVAHPRAGVKPPPPPAPPSSQ